MEMGKEHKIKMERADRAYAELSSILDDMDMSMEEFMASKEEAPEMEESEEEGEMPSSEGSKKKMDLLILLDKGKMKKGA
jgi:hypothetical protein